MLARIASRSLRLPTLRAPPGSSPIASTQWSRTLSNNFRRGPPKKPTDYSKLSGSPPPPKPSSIGPQRSAGPTGAFHSPPSTSAPKSSHEQESVQQSKRREEFSEKASLERNTVPQSEDGGSGTLHESQKQSQNPAHSDLQDEVRSAASRSEKPTPQVAASSEADATETRGPTRLLPDLTQGIPSTSDFETMGSTVEGKRDGTSLNFTEDPSQDLGGRGRGELPASAYISSSERKRLKVANYMYATFAVASLLGYVYLGRDWDSEDEEHQHSNAPSGWDLVLMWNRAKARLGDQMNYYHEPAFKKLLPDPSSDPFLYRPYTLVLSLEDLLVHSEWSREKGWRMAKRPGVDYFLKYLTQYYELVIFTSVPWGMADPVIKKLDPYHVVTWPLFREATMYKDGEYIKDLSYLNRDLSKVIMIDTVPSHAKAQPENAIILPKWKGDPKDKELVSFIPFLEYIATMDYSDVRQVLKSFEGTHIPTEFARREAIARRIWEGQMAEESKKKPKSSLGFLSKALGMTRGSSYEGEQSVSEAFTQGKTLLDMARERGQKNYEQLDKMIQEQGEEWLKEEAANEELMKQEGMKAMKSGLIGFFGVPGGSKPSPE